MVSGHIMLGSREMNGGAQPIFSCLVPHPIGWYHPHSGCVLFTPVKFLETLLNVCMVIINPTKLTMKIRHPNLGKQSRRGAKSLKMI